MPDNNFDSSDLFASPEEERAYAWDVIATGVRFLLFTSVWYGFVIWIVSGFLEKANIAGGRLPWFASFLMAFLITFSRIWDRTFFN